MKEHGMLFVAPMVRAILDGRKTQTRRPVKPSLELSKTPGYTFSQRDRRMRWQDRTLAQQLDAAPHGPVGRRLWVRETWHATAGPNTNCVRYRADEPALQVTWRPSILMPRWASRITLEVTGVRLERAQNITERDARAEGVDSRDAYAKLWDASYGAGSWTANPFVFAYSFRRIF